MAHRCAARKYLWYPDGAVPPVPRGEPLVFRAARRRRRHHVSDLRQERSPGGLPNLSHQYRRRLGIQLRTLQRIARWLRDWLAEYQAAPRLAGNSIRGRARGADAAALSTG